MEGLNNQSQSDFQGKEVSLQDYLRILYHGRWIIGISFVLVMIITTYITFTAQPQYQSTTLLSLAGRAGQTSTLFSNPFMPTNMMKVNNEIEVLKSNALSRRVIAALRQSPYADTLYILGTRHYQQKGIDFKKVFKPLIFGLEAIFQNIPFDTSTSLVDTLDRALVRALQASMKVEPIRETEAVRLTVTSESPIEAAFLANIIAREYYRLDLEFNLGEVVEVKNFLEEQLVDIEKDLTTSEEALKDFQKREGVFGLDETAQTLIDQLSTFEATYYTSLAELEVSKKKWDNQQKMLTDREQMVLKDAVNTTNPLISQLRQAIAEIEAQKITAMAVQGYKTGDAAIRELDGRIQELKIKLYKEAENLTNLGLSPEEQSTISADLLRSVLFTSVEKIALEAKCSEYKDLVNQYAAKLNKLPESSLEYARLDRERQVNEKYFILMKTKHQESRITEASKISNIRIVDPAVPPEKPVKPKKKMNMLLGLFLGLGLGVGIAFVRDYLDHSIKNAEDLQKLGLATVSIIPKIDVKSATEKSLKVFKGENLEHSLKSRLVTHYDPKSSVAEAYRTLRTNIQFMNPDNPIRTLVVSSAGPGDGKSTTVVNIAITFASLGKKTLLIDSDLRKPILHKVFDISRGPGLTHAMIEDLNDSDIIRATEIPNLYIITCGDIPPNPSEILSSQKLKNFIERMKSEFEIVLFDSPPIIAVTDASVISKMTDAILLVVKAGVTDTRVVARAIELLRQVKTHLIGAVLNGVNITGGYDSYYYYYNYYYYYGDGGKKKKKSRFRKNRSASPAEPER